MKAIVWNGINNISTKNVPDPSIVNPHDVVLKVRLSSVCGSDLHLMGGYVPAMKPGDIIGHEFMGDVVETGREVRKLKKGDRVVAISVLGCGHCYFCATQQYSCCDNTKAKPAALRAHTRRDHRLQPRFRRRPGARAGGPSCVSARCFIPRAPGSTACRSASMRAASCPSPSM